jgi:hypothetical protein
MKREFVYTAKFDKNWVDAGLTDDDLRALEEMLLENPEAGSVIPHMSGARKIRFAIQGVRQIGRRACDLR